jgi:hypothetical protein
MYIYNIYEFLKKVKNKSIKLWFCFVWFLFGFCLVFVWFCVDLLYAPHYHLAYNRDIHPFGIDISGFFKWYAPQTAFYL